jgi:hypothetical protein
MTAPRDRSYLQQRPRTGMMSTSSVGIKAATLCSKTEFLRFRFAPIGNSNCSKSGGNLKNIKSVARFSEPKFRGCAGPATASAGVVTARRAEREKSNIVFGFENMRKSPSRRGAAAKAAGARRGGPVCTRNAEK